LPGWLAAKRPSRLTNLAASIGHVSAGRLRALGITSRTEAPQLPGVPPIASTLPGFRTNAGWFGIGGAGGTPKGIIAKVYQDTKKALDTTEMKAALLPRRAGAGRQFAGRVRHGDEGRDCALANVVKERNIHVQ